MNIGALGQSKAGVCPPAGSSWLRRMATELMNVLLLMKSLQDFWNRQLPPLPARSPAGCASATCLMSESQR